MRTTALILPLALLAGSALAQEVKAPAAPTPPAVTAPTPPTGGMGGGMMMHGQNNAGQSKMSMMGGGMMMQCPMMKGEHVEGKIAFLHTELKITPAQEDAWKGFAATLRAEAESMKDHQGMMASKGEMQMNMKMRIDMMEKKVTSMKAQQAAMEKLLPLLSEEQKKSADELLAHYK